MTGRATPIQRAETEGPAWTSHRRVSCPKGSELRGVAGALRGAAVGSVQACARGRARARYSLRRGRRIRGHDLHRPVAQHQGSGSVYRKIQTRRNGSNAFGARASRLLRKTPLRPEVEAGGERFRLLPPEELLWSKLYVLQHERCDWPDILNLLQEMGSGMNWR